MVSNVFFAQVVRIEWDHQVSIAGPHRYARHPGYVGMVLELTLLPLLLASLPALFPGVAAALLPAGW